MKKDHCELLNLASRTSKSVKCRRASQDHHGGGLVTGLRGARRRRVLGRTDYEGARPRAVQLPAHSLSAERFSQRNYDWLLGLLNAKTVAPWVVTS
jgi:hypothetical protein